MTFSDEKPESIEEATRRIAALADAYRASRVLFCAYDSGLFSILDKPHSLEGIAAALDWEPRGARLMLNALLALNLVEYAKGLFQNTPASNHLLKAGAPAFLGHYIAHSAKTAASWEGLSEALFRGRGPFQGRHAPASEELRLYLLAMRDLATINAPRLVEALDLSGRKRLLDLGSGCGGYSLACLRAYPALRAVMVDCPEAIAMARHEAEEAGLLPRCGFLASDALDGDIGTGYDAVFLGNVLHGYGAEGNRCLLHRCYDALNPEGLLAIRDFLWEENASAPPEAPLFSLHLFLHTECGECHSLEDVRKWAGEAGFIPGGMTVLGEKSRLFTATKPGTT